MKNILSFIIISLFACQLLAQVTDTTALESENVAVYKSYEAAVAQATQKSIDIVTPVHQIIKKNYSYKLNNKKSIDFERSNPVIRPLAYDNEGSTITDLKDATIYGAYGNLRTIKAGGAYQYYIEDWLDAGIKIDHFSNKAQTYVNKQIPSLMNTQGKIYASYFLSPKTKVGVEGNGRWNNRATQFLPTSELDTTNYNLPTNQIGAAVNFSHTSFETSGFAIRSRFAYDRMRRTLEYDNLYLNENKMSLDNNIYKKLGESMAAEVDVKYRNYISTVEANSNNNSVTNYDLIVRPRISYTSVNYTLSTGVEMIRTSGDNYLFPIANIKIPSIIAEIDLSIYTDTDYNRYSLHSLVEDNPFAILNTNETNAMYRRSINLQLDRSIIGAWNASIRFSYNDYQNDIQYINNGNPMAITPTTFDYTFIDRKEVSITPTVGIVDDLIDLNLSMTYNHFLGDNKDDLLYTPRINVDLSATEKLLNNKLFLSQSISYNSSFNGQYEIGDIIGKSGFADISGKIEFKVSRTFSVFVEGVNLLDSNYEQWHNVYNNGRQFWGGVKLRM